MTAIHSSTACAARRPAAPAFSRGQRAMLLLCVAAIAMLRLPQVWLHGRFLDEEGAIFFAEAWHRSAGEALWRPFAGYLNLGANGTTLLAARLVRAGVVPLERAPYLTMTAALLVQLVPAALILTARAAWLANRWAVLASLLILVTAPMTEEVFADVLHIQFHLALAAALILALAVPRSRAGRAGSAAVLVLAPLCGPGAVVLLPLFVLRAAVDRDAGRAVQTAAFAAGVAVQLLLFFSRSPVRGHLLDPATLAAVMGLRLAAMPFVGPWAANWLGRRLHASYAGGGLGWWFAVAAAVAWFGALARLAARDRRDPAIWLVLSGLAIAAASFGGGMIATDSAEWFSVGSGERYNFLPLVLLGLALVALAMRPGARWRRRGCAGLCVLAVAWGAIPFPFPIRELSHGPSWAGEVAAWRRNHDHPLAVWPGSWTADLSDRDRPCPPAATATDAAPSYCESAWVARVLQAGQKAPRPGR